ncbi:MAG: hypothetical protein BZ133_02505 [Methanosphaera sp. SHI613]|jgi:hypothetical protein|nr:MAG: hypothetical protein BZ133_02505 [Methanosphaera sp. SHI613]
MDGSKTIAIIIIVALILSIGIVGVNSYFIKSNEKQGTPSSILMTPDNLENATFFDNEATNKTELNFILNNTTQVQPVINMNIHQKVGSANVIFADTDNIYNITSSNYNNSSTTVRYTQNNDSLDVDVSSNSAANTIVLSNKYIYNINGEVLCGGFATNFTPESQVRQLNVNVTLGGVQIQLNNNKIQDMDVHITVGGLDVRGSPSGYSHLESEIKVGGLNFEDNNQKVYVRSGIELGGNNPGNYHKESIKGWDNFMGSAYQQSEDKLDVTSRIQIGGLNIA